MAFVKVNGLPFPKILEAAFLYFWQPRLYTWQRPAKESVIDLSNLEKVEEMRQNMTLQEKLKSIALKVTTGKFLPRPAGEVGKKERYQVVTFLSGEKKIAKRVDY